MFGGGGKRRQKTLITCIDTKGNKPAKAGKGRKMDDTILNGIHDANEEEPRLLFEQAFEDSKKGIGIDGLEGESPVLRNPETLHLKELSREDTKELYRRYIRKPGKSRIKSDPDAPAPPYMAEVLKLSTCEDMSEFWNMVAEAIPEDKDYKEIADHWIAAVKRKNDKFEELEDAIADLGDPELLRLAGVSEEDDDKNFVVRRPAIDDLSEHVMENGDFPKKFNINFSKDYVEVNSIPTNIPVVFLKNTYIGLTGLLSHERAINIISKILRKRLNPLFGRKRNEKSLDQSKEK